MVTRHLLHSVFFECHFEKWHSRICAVREAGSRGRHALCRGFSGARKPLRQGPGMQFLAHTSLAMYKCALRASSPPTNRVVNIFSILSWYDLIITCRLLNLR